MSRRNPPMPTAETYAPKPVATERAGIQVHTVLVAYMTTQAVTKGYHAPVTLSRMPWGDDNDQL